MDENKSVEEDLAPYQQGVIPSPFSDVVLRAMLNEHGEDEQSADVLVSVLARLGEWQAPVPSEADAQQLMSVLLSIPGTLLNSAAPQTIAPSLSVKPLAYPQLRDAQVRQVLQQRFAHAGSGIGWLFEVTRLQGMLLRPSFWLASAFICVIGMLVLLLGMPGNGYSVLRLLGPLLAAFGVAAAFRSVRLNMLEIELSCPISPMRLTLVRLTLVLGYDVALGLLMSVAFVFLNGHSGNGNPADLVLMTVGHWLAPLLMVAGLALLLCLHLPVESAAALAYVCWLLLLVPSIVEDANHLPGPFTYLLSNGEAIVCIVGILLGAITLFQMRLSIARLLPHG